MSRPIAFSVCTPFGSRFRITPDEAASLRTKVGPVVTERPDGSFSVRDWWIPEGHAQVTHYSPIYRTRKVAA